MLCWNDELRNDLKKLGIEAEGSNKELSDMLELTKYLRRRANLRCSGVACDGDDGVPKMPVDMSLRCLEKELEDRKIVLAEPGRKARIVALEEALLKEVEGLVGDGFDFGRRFLSVEDLLPSDELNDCELREELKARGLKAPRKKQEKLDLLYKVWEEDMESRVQECFREELLDEMVRLGVGPLKHEANDKIIESDLVKGSSNLVTLPEKEKLSYRLLQQSHENSHPSSCLPPASSSSRKRKSPSSNVSSRTRSKVKANVVESPERSLQKGVASTNFEEKLSEQEETLLDEEDMVSVRSPKIKANPAGSDSGYETPAKRVRKFAEESFQRTGLAEFFGAAPLTPSDVAAATQLARAARQLLEPLGTNELFITLFQSDKWRDEYREPPCEVRRGNCRIQ